MKNKLKLIFENNTYYFNNYFQVLKMLLKLEYSFKVFKKKDRYFLQIYKNNNIVYEYSYIKIVNYSVYDYLISNFINENIENIFIFNDFSLFDNETGEIFENNKNKLEYEYQKNILIKYDCFIFNDNVICLNENDKVVFFTKKNHSFTAYYLYKKDNFFCFSYYGVFNRKRYLFLTEKEINELYFNVYNCDTQINIDYSVYLIYYFNISFNAIKNPLRLIDIKDFLNERLIK